MKSLSLCGKSSFASANAAIVDEKVPKSTTQPATMKLFSRPWPRG